MKILGGRLPGQAKPEQIQEEVGRGRPAERRRHSNLIGALAIAIGVLGSGIFVWQGTTAVFSSTTSNASNSWTAGAVSLADDDAGSAEFNASGLVPGSTGSNCITVTYTGSVATAVKLYVSAYNDTQTLAQYLDLVIEEGTGGGFGSCGSFVAGTTIFTGTLATLDTTKVAYGSGVGTWAPSSSGSKVYRISYTMNASTPSNKQGSTTTATFTWEAQA